jgi:hypothetical protein
MLENYRVVNHKKSGNNPDIKSSANGKTAAHHPLQKQENKICTLFLWCPKIFHRTLAIVSLLDKIRKNIEKHSISQVLIDTDTFIV